MFLNAAIPFVTLLASVISPDEVLRSHANELRRQVHIRGIVKGHKSRIVLALESRPLESCVLGGVDRALHPMLAGGG